MKFVEKSGKSVEEALRLALIELEASREQVDIEVLEEGAKGFLGIGAKDSRIRVTKRNNVIDTARNFLSSILKEMKINTELEFEQVGEVLNINMIGEDMAILIGKRGQTLDSLQYLVSLVVNKERDEYLRVVLDTENYRAKRKETLESLAEKLASKVKKSRKNVILEPMNPYERRIIHSALQNNPNVSTKSEGDEPYRKVVIYFDYKKNKTN
ncbi:RNA-binding cell elongation regulator Jag/EloR [Fusibacter bizertensis]|uniref:RNA-binding protein KhpB n=1 Tax=Fusibacter bizertensis TaxID=1488331 RepID=A0ABT6NFH0_9FIRM|nr:RNA-binding cell elongation regulator Jag/EloR [Fusibacter bizertensis]MDH8679178.1 RNA-binding cell elongation regulator Jag/EloR [Fusibacter bizertensis]